MINISINDIMVLNRTVSSNGVIYKVVFYGEKIRDDFKERVISSEVVVEELNDGTLKIVDWTNGYEKSVIEEKIKEANITTYTVYYYDTYKDNFLKENVLGLKNILDLNRSNSVVEVIKVK